MSTWLLPPRGEARVPGEVQNTLKSNETLPPARSGQRASSVTSLPSSPHSLNEPRLLVCLPTRLCINVGPHPSRESSWGFSEAKTEKYIKFFIDPAQAGHLFSPLLYSLSKNAAKIPQARLTKAGLSFTIESLGKAKGPISI